MDRTDQQIEFELRQALILAPLWIESEQRWDWHWESKDYCSEDGLSSPAAALADFNKTLHLLIKWEQEAQ
jgi:hypothetical protein